MGYHTIICGIENCDYKATGKKDLKNHKKQVHTY